MNSRATLPPFEVVEGGRLGVEETLGRQDVVGLLERGRLDLEGT